MAPATREVGNYGGGMSAAAFFNLDNTAEEAAIDLSQSWAYSDSSSDIPMFELVGHPVAVNPDARLARVAAARGWEVLRFERLKRRLAIGGGGMLALALGAAAVVVTLRSRRSTRGRHLG